MKNSYQFILLTIILGVIVLAPLRSYSQERKKEVGVYINFLPSDHLLEIRDPHLEELKKQSFRIGEQKLIKVLRAATLAKARIEMAKILQDDEVISHLYIVAQSDSKEERELPLTAAELDNVSIERRKLQRRFNNNPYSQQSFFPVVKMGTEGESFYFIDDMPVQGELYDAFKAEALFFPLKNRFAKNAEVYLVTPQLIRWSSNEEKINRQMMAINNALGLVNGKIYIFPQENSSHHGYFAKFKNSQLDIAEDGLVEYRFSTRYNGPNYKNSIKVNRICQPSKKEIDENSLLDSQQEVQDYLDFLSFIAR